MKLRLKETGERFDAPRGIGMALLATGTCEEILPAKPPDPGPSEWKLNFGNVSNVPYITFRCPRCKASARVESIATRTFKQVNPSLPDARNGREFSRHSFDRGLLVKDEEYHSAAENAERIVRAAHFAHCNGDERVPEPIIQQFIEAYKRHQENDKAHFAKLVASEPKFVSFVEGITPATGETGYAPGDPSGI
ncbi:MAG TPA: hypothetical protein VKS44_08600 [Candidatus Acidoferrales bacterium]|nr:hypothetical protein [Candidatus Acidoferrales bacterium]